MLGPWSKDAGPAQTQPAAPASHPTPQSAPTIGVRMYDGGRDTQDMHGIGRNNPLWSTSRAAVKKTAYGTRAAPVDGASPAVWQETWLRTDYTSLGGTGPSAQGVASALYQTIKVGGTGTFNCVLGYARNESSDPGGSIGVRGVADGLDCRGRADLFCGLWGEVESPAVHYDCVSFGLEINAYQNLALQPPVSDPLYSTGNRTAGIIVNNYQKRSQVAGKPGDYRNHFGVALTSDTAGTRAFGYHTGLYISDTAEEAIRIRSGVFGSVTERTRYGIKFEGPSCSVAGVDLGDNLFQWGNYTSSHWPNGAMWANSGALYYRRDGLNTEVMCARGAGTSAQYVPNRKIAVKIGGATYYLLASTTA